MTAGAGGAGLEHGGAVAELRMVHDAAAALELREYDLFRLAWRRWYGNDPDPATLERVFAGYMFRQEVPPWVRLLARDVLQRQAQGPLGAREFGADALRGSEPPARHGRIYVAVVAILVVLYVVGLGGMMGDGADQPPIGCDGGPGMGYVEAVAQHFTGKADPFGCRR